MLKSQWDATTHLLEQLNLFLMTVPDAGEATKQAEHSYITSGNVLWKIVSEKSQTYSYHMIQ